MTPVLGRPKRRGTSARLEQLKPLTSTYVRSLNSSSDSDQENKTHTGHKKTTDWDNLRGIISDDASSDWARLVKIGSVQKSPEYEQYLYKLLFFYNTMEVKVN